MYEDKDGVRVMDLNGDRPKTDEKCYRLLRLQNGLRAVLIHDPKTADSVGKGE